jgi:Arc/MetJ family transcription regulator
MLAKKRMWAVVPTETKSRGANRPERNHYYKNAAGRQCRSLLRGIELASSGHGKGITLWYYVSSMKEKTSITLSADILADVDQLAGRKLSRSAFIESVLRHYIREKRRAQAHAQDLERINSAVDELNSEASDVLDYQSSGE